MGRERKTDNRSETLELNTKNNNSTRLYAYTHLFIKITSEREKEYKAKQRSEREREGIGNYIYSIQGEEMTKKRNTTYFPFVWEKIQKKILSGKLPDTTLLSLFFLYPFFSGCRMTGISI